MALAMIMLPTGISEVMAVSITPAQVMTAVTNPAPAAIEYVDTLRAPGMFLARLAEIEPAARTMPVSRKTLVQRGLFSRRARIDPTATIWTMPRNSAVAASLSK